MIKNVITGISLVAALTALYFSLQKNGSSRQVFIDTGKVYSEFQLSKELNGKLEEVFKARKAITDSLYREIRQKTEELKQQPTQTLDEMAKIAKLEEGLYIKQQQFDKENQSNSADYSSKIWGRLNQYIMDFGKKHDFTFILGANGEGSLMYADKSNDITDEVIKYVNDRYNDKIEH